MPPIDVNQTMLNYSLEGPEGGAVVMFSNSLAANLAMWDAQVPVLTAAGYRVLRYDSRGHGRSGVPEGPYTMEMLTADAVGLMDALGLGKVHFCGLSKGGMVGQMLGTHHADRLVSLTLCDTAAYLGPREVWEERMRAARGQGMAALVDAFIDRWFTKPGQKQMPGEIEKVRGMISETPVEGFCGCCCAIRDMDQRESVRTINTPTLVMVGEHDPGTPVSAATYIHEQIASSQLKIIEDAAHFINVQQKNVFNAALLKFLTENGGTA